MPQPALPRLILLPGLSGGETFFEPLISALRGKAETRVVTYPADRQLSYDALADHVTAALPANGPYVVVAESFGGPLAVLAAARAANKPAGVVLAATFATNPLPLMGMILKTALPGFLASKPVPVIEAMLLRSGDHMTALHIFEAVSALPQDVLMSRLNAALKCDIRKPLAALDMPMLYLQGTKDKLMPAAQAVLMQKTAKNLRVIKVDRPHFVLQYEPEILVADVLVPFLKSLK
jgi:pimeloyl-ACP methyl ester carboxylesterase